MKDDLLFSTGDPLFWNRHVYTPYSVRQHQQTSEREQARQSVENSQINTPKAATARDRNYF